MSTIEGRKNGSRFQHDKHRSHHLSVIREHVVSILGRSGTPCEILTMTLIGFGLGWNGTSRVNISSVVIPKAQTSLSAVTSHWSDARHSGAVYGSEPPRRHSTVMLNVDVTRKDKPKSQSRARPSSEINTFVPFRSPWNMGWQ